MRLGIALEGGGVRCAAQVGALLALQEAGIRPSFYAGCGTGALVAALAATDSLTEAAAESFLRAAYGHTILRNKALNRRLRAQFGAIPLRDAPYLAMPTVDMESGAIQVLASMLPLRPDPRPWSRQALLSTAVRIAMAQPGVLPPVGWRGRRMAGGGHLRAALPGILRTMGAEHTLLIRVLEPGCAQYERDPAALALCAHAMAAAPAPSVDIVLTVNGYAPGHGVLERATYAPLLKAGHMAALKAIPALEVLLGDVNGKIILFPGAETEGSTI